MNVDIKYLGYETSEELRVYTEYRFKIELRKMSDRIAHVTVRIVDLPGGNAAGAIMCRASLRFKSGQTLFLEEKNPSLIELIDIASNKIAESAFIMDSQWRENNPHAAGKKKVPGKAWQQTI